MLTCDDDVDFVYSPSGTCLVLPPCWWLGRLGHSCRSMPKQWRSSSIVIYKVQNFLLFINIYLIICIHLFIYLMFLEYKKCIKKTKQNKPWQCIIALNFQKTGLSNEYPILYSLLKIQFYQVAVRKFTSTMLAPPTLVRERAPRRSENNYWRHGCNIGIF